eukprot:Protomagalhaensia_wolfi_Nauph_80__2446@NODE_2619_length_1038_cov_136_532533_g2051_i0_p1_GENE_NODE_2619_length_1038_cov_136_532533_g2051_i0NODE_2619_length_1038_cov_136_532533_g2051_i0_p1_ORF_typecomplete_len261_score42_27CD20/PF04103_15/29CD20/PF04103_15/3Treacle/PF03546_14/0_065TFIIF_alpha/PF05793_12/0_067DUF5336/PF17270_2/1_9e02DUF5336/PF17270_2/0_81DUF5336/PF17270_2/1_8e04FtsX/PF02687_21/1_9e03FtsX/PF02687_21/5_NODE_2619_length_1038_cov_136_532533_g2051_i0133915
MGDDKKKKAIPATRNWLLAGGFLVILQGVLVFVADYDWYPTPIIILGLFSMICCKCTGCLCVSLAIAGVLVCGYQLYQRLDSLIWSSHLHTYTAWDFYWLWMGLQIGAAVAAGLGLIVYAMVFAKNKEKRDSDSSDSPDSSIDEEKNRKTPPLQVKAVPPTPPTTQPPIPPYPHPMYPPPHGHQPPLQPAQLVTHHGAPPQPILIAGPPPQPGTAGALYPVGQAYVAYPPHSNRDQIPIQPLTGQPILAAPPVMYDPRRQ